MNLEGMLRFAEKFGEAEIYWEEESSLTARYNLDYIETGLHDFSTGFGVRLVVNGSIGFAYFTRESEYRDAIRKASKLARLRGEKGYELPYSHEGKRVDNFSPRVADLEFEDLVSILDEVIAGIRRERAKPMQGEVVSSVGKTEIINSTGLHVIDRSSRIELDVSSYRGTGTGYDFWSSSELDFDPRNIGISAGRDARLLSTARKLGYEGIIALHPDVFDSLLGVVYSAVNGESVRRGKSPWSDKLGENVAGKLTLIEDPWLPYFPGTCGFDDEGVPTSKKPIIKDGILERFVYDTRTASLSDTKSTGNGFRDSYQSEPEISLTNVVVEFPESEPMKDMDEFLFIRSLMGYHNMNIKTGDFALTIDGAFLHKNGKVMPVKGSMFIGNVFDILKRIELSSEEIFRRGNFLSPVIFFHGKIIV